MHRRVVLLALVGCEAPAVPPDPVLPHVVYPAAPLAWPLGELRGHLGRSQAPQPALSRDIVGDPKTPLRLPTPWAVPGDGPARAIVYGLDHERHLVELIEIDRGRVVWRDDTCAAPVVGVTAEAVVCADAHGTRAIGLDGRPRWKTEQQFIAITDEHLVMGGAGESVILDAATGNELARVALPKPVTSDSILASCGDAGRELFASGQDGKLVRIAEGQGGPKIAWSVPLGTVAGIEACIGTTVLVTTSSEAGTSLVAIARDTGKVSGRIDGVRGYWYARDSTDRLEVSTTNGVASYPRDLASAAVPIALPVLGELLAKREDRRLVRATPLTAALLDRRGVRAYLPLHAMGAVLGDDAILAASWIGSAANTVHRIGLPPPWQHPLRVRPRRPALGVPAELRDLPPPVTLGVEGAVPRPGTAMHSVELVALDPIDPRALYAVTMERPADAGIARFDLEAHAWSWYRPDGCGAGVPVAIAIARELVVCGARGQTGVTVRATGRDGTPRWDWSGEAVDAVAAAADIVLVHAAERLIVLDGTDGKLLGMFASDDGAPIPAAALDIAGMALLVTYERGRIVARLPHVEMVPAWSIAVDGVVRALSPSGDGVLVELDDGDAYRIDARTAETIALPGLDLAWSASGDAIAGEASGGPVPPDRMPAPPPKRVLPPVRRPILDKDVDLPPIATPWPAPPPMAASWQATLYELGGGLRTRNDYALAAPVAPAWARGPGDSVIIVSFGPGLREALVIDPRRGDPLRRVKLPDDVPSGVPFSTVVDGRPIAGMIVAAPLRAVLF